MQDNKTSKTEALMNAREHEKKRILLRRGNKKKQERRRKMLSDSEFTFCMLTGKQELEKVLPKCERSNRYHFICKMNNAENLAIDTI